MNNKPGKARPAGAKGGRKGRAKDGKGTKERIFLASVDLFARHGYDGVTTREIAKAVGIKDSSIYKHYASKEAILDEIFDYFKSRMFDADLYLEEAVRMKTIASVDDFFYGFEKLFPLAMSDPTLAKTLRIITIESYHNEKIKRFFQEEMVAKSLAILEKAFGMMIEQKMIKPHDPKILANEFYGHALYLLFQHVILEPDGLEGISGDNSKIWRQQLDHTKFFIDAVKIDR